MCVSTGCCVGFTWLGNKGGPGGTIPGGTVVRVVPGGGNKSVRTRPFHGAVLIGGNLTATNLLGKEDRGTVTELLGGEQFAAGCTVLGQVLRPVQRVHLEVKADNLCWLPHRGNEGSVRRS